MTYDELISRSKAQVENLLGPLSISTQNLDIYFYRDDPEPSAISGLDGTKPD
jgi:hypothetical protein